MHAFASIYIYNLCDIYVCVRVFVCDAYTQERNDMVNKDVHCTCTGWTLYTTVPHTALGFFTVGQFALRKKISNQALPNLT